MSTTWTSERTSAIAVNALRRTIRRSTLTRKKMAAPSSSMSWNPDSVASMNSAICARRPARAPSVRTNRSLQGWPPRPSRRIHATQRRGSAESTGSAVPGCAPRPGSRPRPPTVPTPGSGGPHPRATPPAYSRCDLDEVLDTRLYCSGGNATALKTAGLKASRGVPMRLGRAARRGTVRLHAAGCRPTEPD